MKEGLLSKTYFFILCTYVFIIPQYNLEGDNKFNLYDVLFYGLLLISSIQIFFLFIKGEIITPILKNKSILWLFIFMFLSGASYFWSEANKPVSNVSQLIKILIVVTPILLLNFEEDQFSTLFKVYFFGTVIGSLQIVYNYYFNAEYSYGIKRSFLTGIDSNESAILIAIGFSLALFYYFKNKNILYLFPCIPQVIAVFYTGSRTGFIAVFISLLLALFFFKVLKFKLSSLLIILTLVGVIYLLPIIVPSENLNRIIHIGKNLSDREMSGRTMIWAEAMLLIPKKLFIGYGMSSFADVLEKHYERFNAHNVFIKVQFELGILGSFTLLMLLLYSIKTILRNKNVYKPVILISFIIIVISLLQLSWIYSLNILVLFSLILNSAGNYDVKTSESKSVNN